MGKKKDGTGKVRLPKRVAGVKVPKELRKGAEALVAQAQSEAGRAALLQGVSVVAGIAATAARAAAAKATAAAQQPAATPAEPVAAANTPPKGDAIAQAVTAGIDAALGRLFPKR